MRFKLYLNRWIGIILIVLSANYVWGQQDPMYTQYNFNTQTINPAYAGTWESTGFIVLGRQQWVGFDFAPQTFTFSMQTVLDKRKVGLGLNVISDKIGKEQRLGVFGDYSYRIQFGTETYLRLGLKFGVTNYTNSLWTYTQYPGAVDYTSLSEITALYMPNFGVGAFLASPKYYVGLSVPKIIENQYQNDDNNYSVHGELRHFYLITGYVFDLSEYVKFKPAILTKATIGAPVEFDVSANFLLAEKVWLGANYRTSDSFGCIAQWIFDKRLRVGYAVDFATTELKNFNSGSHEVMVSYETGFKKIWSSPRKF